MALSNQPANPHRNTPPMVLTQGGYTDPYQVVGQSGLPKEVYDTVVGHCREMMSEDTLGFLDEFQMTKSFRTDYVEFLETTTRDQVIDDDGAVSRSGNVFTIVPASIDGWEAGEDYFYFKVDDSIYVVDNNGLMEQGVITAVNKGANQFTAVSMDGAAWAGLTTNISIDTMGSDFDRCSCGPEGDLELRKTTSRFLKLATSKKAMKTCGGKRYAWCLDGEWKWYDENKMRVRKALNKEVSKKLLISIQSVDGSAAHAVGKYGTQGLFDNVKENGATFTGYITTEAELRTVTAYWDSLGLKRKEFVVQADTTQYEYLEVIAAGLADRMNVTVQINMENRLDNYARFGYTSMDIAGYTIHFKKWHLTDGNSSFGKNRIKAAMPKALFIPMGTTTSKINGVEQTVPFIFKAYQVFPEFNQNNMVREFLTGAFAPTPTNDCEYEKLTLSTTVGLVVICPELFVIVV